MICNQSLASNAVMSLTNPVGTSWMIEEINNRTPTELRQSILVHGGGTRSLDSEVFKIASMLRQEGYEVFTDLEDDKDGFDYHEDTWRKIGVVVCRPGAGTATECVKWKIPMLVLRDKRNSEAEFNAEVLIRLGIAHELPNRRSNEDLIKFVTSVTAVESRKIFLEPFERCGRNGIVEAVNFLEDYWGLSRQVK
jgi:UDP-N-acetylglucosamine:LPS N-acetylglucosamine transferase